MTLDDRDAKQPGLAQKLVTHVARDGGIAVAGQFAGRFFALLIQLLLTRVLGVAGYGLYSLGQSTLVIARTLSMFGLQTGVVRFASIYHSSKDSPRLKGTIKSAVWLSFGFSVIVSLLLFLFAETIAVRVFSEPGLSAPLRLFSLALPFYTLVGVSGACVRALQRIDYDVIVVHLVRPFLTLVAVAGSFLLGYRLMGAVAGFAISAFVSAGLGLLLIRRAFPDIVSGQKARVDLRGLLSYSATVLLVGISHLLIMRTDRIMLGILGTAEQVGIYNSAATVAVQASVFLVAFNAIFSPVIARLFHQRRMDEIAALFKTVTKWIFTLTFPVVLVFVLFGRPIMALFGAGFSVAAPVLAVLAIAQLVNAGVGSVGYILTMSGRHKLELVNSVVLGALNVGLNLILIPRFDALGAGIATGISLALINLVRLAEVYWLYRLQPYKISYWKPIVAGVTATAVWMGVSIGLDPTGWTWLAAIAMFGVVYLVALAGLKLDSNDRVVLAAVGARVSGLLGRRKR